jgi:hypothetical protein
LFPGDVRNEEEFFAVKRGEKSVDCCRRREFAEQELENPNSTDDFYSVSPIGKISGAKTPPTMTSSLWLFICNF